MVEVGAGEARSQSISNKPDLDPFGVYLRLFLLHMLFVSGYKLLIGTDFI